MRPALAVVSLLTACSIGPSPVSRSPNDPSSPDAPEGSPPPATVASAPLPARTAPPSDHDHHDHGGARSGEAAGYVCPMHPEVTSSTPGVCPKCNMKLVPQK